MEITPIFVFNMLILVFFVVAFFYQIVYIFVVFRHKHAPYHVAKTFHTYAVVICAHNEGVVIGELIESVKEQDYPKDKLDVFVFCDNCTDDTAELARAAGAIVYERPAGGQIGKSWVMDYGLNCVMRDYPGRYEGFFVFDADNVLTPNYVREMNNVFDEGKYDAVTSYRNSKNFDSSWISRGYGTWFLREAKYLNNARMILGTSCAISGTGYLMSAKVIEAMHGWDFHLLTEDIQFSTFAALNGMCIGYAQKAVFFDEQPVTFAASWRQRMRWTKGFYQVLVKYGHNLVHELRLKNAPKRANGRFAVYDMLMTLAPAMILTLISVTVNALYLLIGLFFPTIISASEQQLCVGALLMTILSFYVVFFLLAILVEITERKSIHCRKIHLFTNLFTFPLFMLSYVPIALAAAVQKVSWVPTKHTISKSLDDINKE
ncbi:MAG: glycosyltransferase family 2 protein [Coriobacteriales bacterium]|jgi:1,2-diacylglycerol 3-beta-glucosyltransferase